MTQDRTFQVNTLCALLLVFSWGGLSGQTATISTFAGSGGSFLSPAGNAATARIGGPFDLDIDSRDNVYLVNDEFGLRGQSPITHIYRISQAAQVSLAFTLTAGYSSIAGVAISDAGDAAFVTSASFFGDSVARLDSKGQANLGTNYKFLFSRTSGSAGIRARSGLLYVVDPAANRIIRIGTDNKSSIIGGTGVGGFSGDGGSATQAQFYYPTAIAVDASGNVFVADTSNHCIRKISAAGRVSTIAGTCTQEGFSGDTGPATAAKLYMPRGVAVGPDGTVFLSDTGNNRIRRVNLDNTIETIAGTGNSGCFNDPFSQNCFFGDGGPATRAKLNGPTGLALDSQGRLYIADTDNNRIRMLTFGPAPSATSPLIADKGIVNSASLTAPVARGSWATVYGANFTSEPARGWTAEDFSGGILPTSLNGVSVSFNDRPAAILYIDAKQINVQVPDGLPSGEVTVKVTSAGGTAVSGVQHQAIAPGLFPLASIVTGQARYYYPVAIHSDGTLVGRPTVVADSRPAIPGEIIFVYGTGFGPSNPPRPSGIQFEAASLDAIAVVEIGSERFVALDGILMSPGLYVFSIVVPNVRDRADYQMTIGFLGGAKSQSDIYLPIN